MCHGRVGETERGRRSATGDGDESSHGRLGEVTREERGHGCDNRSTVVVSGHGGTGRGEWER